MDKVRCPYCGSTMGLWVDSYSDGTVGGAFYTCPDCKADSPYIEDADDIEGAAHAAAMQRWQEPLKPMTLDELTTIAESTPIYVLHRYGEWQQNGWHIWSPCPDDRDCEIHNTGNYGITWDAYLHRPTDEERKAVRWEDD